MKLTALTFYMVSIKIIGAVTLRVSIYLLPHIPQTNITFNSHEGSARSEASFLLHRKKN